MNYPLLSEYIEAIKAAEDNFNELSNLRPVLDDDGNPIMSSGNFAVVFKMKDEQTGKFHAVKCFLKEQEGRSDAYRLIAEELEYVSSTFLTPIKYLDKELFVDSNTSDETEFPVLLMDWIEGITLDKYIREHLDEQYDLAMLTYQFSRLAMWLMPQPFAHGDLKPDNILVKDDGTLVLVDYDGMYVPAMKGQKARELGSPNFRHPSRTENDFNEHIDDFTIAVILLSLKALTIQPELLGRYGAPDRLLMSEKDYRDISHSKILKELFPSNNIELNIVYSLFLLSHSKIELNEQVSKSLIVIEDNLYKRAELYCHGSSTRTYNYWESICKKEELPIAPDKDKAYVLFQDLAIRGCIDAQCCMGCFLWKKGTMQDRKKSLQWYQLAAKNGNIRAAKHIYQHGEKLFKGEEEKCDYSEAFKLFQISANYGNESAIMMLGFCHENGLGTSINKALAQKWYDKIKTGRIAYSIGKMYFEGNNIKSDFQQAINWFNKAIEMNDALAFPYMAVCYTLGLGVKQNFHIANKIFNKPISMGYFNLMNYYYKHNKYRICHYLLIICYNKLGNIDNLYKIMAKNYAKLLEKKGFVRLDENVSYNVLDCIHGIFESELLSLSTEVTEEDLANAWTDEFGVMYSADRKRLLKCQKDIHYYNIITGTIIICNKAFEEILLKKIQIPSTVVKIGMRAFCDCSVLEDIQIPESVISIGGGAFYNCTNLSSIIIPRSVSQFTTIDSLTGLSTSFSFVKCYNLTHIIVEKWNPFFDSRNDCNALINTKSNTLIAGCKNTIIPDSVTSIGEHAFSGCIGLTNIEIPDSVTSIEEGAFYGCSNLKEIIIPNSVETIGEAAFWGCSSLSKIRIPNSLKQIGRCAFLGCKGIQIVEILNSTVTIEIGAFNECDSLKKITVPQNSQKRFKEIFLSNRDYDQNNCEHKIVEQ